MKMKKLQISYYNAASKKATGEIVVREGTQLKGAKFMEERNIKFSYKTLPLNIQELLTAYGLRALLADRTSDARSLGVNKLNWYEQVYKDLTNDVWFKKVTRKPAEDLTYVAELVAEIKNCTTAQASLALKSASKEWISEFKKANAAALDLLEEAAKTAAVDLPEIIALAPAPEGEPAAKVN